MEHIDEKLCHVLISTNYFDEEDCVLNIKFLDGPLEDENIEATVEIYKFQTEE